MDRQQEWEILQSLAKTTEGVCVDVDWGSGLAEINQNGVTVFMPWRGEPPWPGDRVRIDTAGKQRVCEPVHGSPMGTVVSVASGLATVTGDDGRTYIYPHRGTAPTSGNRVRLDHPGRAVASGVYSAEPAGSDIVLPPPAPSSVDSATFTPIWSGQWWYDNFNGDTPQHGSTTMGAYGFGRQIPGTVPAGATVTKCDLRLTQNWDRLPDIDADMGTHAKDSRPGTLFNSDVSGSISVPTGSRTVDILSFASALVAGTALGVAFRRGSDKGWRQYAAAPACQIYMEWRTS